jgi:DNA-binding NarL/FixJ family response regulator
VNTDLPAPSRPIRVLCVDDSRDITATLGRCIAREPDMESVGSLHSADDLVRQVDERRADVVLLDMTMPGKDPLAALRDLRAHAAARVLVFSGRDDQEAVEMAAEAGASGFLSKDAKIPVMLDAIRQVARSGAGEMPFRVWL